jgi:hypothetical protein
VSSVEYAYTFPSIKVHVTFENVLLVYFNCTAGFIMTFPYMLTMYLH